MINESVVCNGKPHPPRSATQVVVPADVPPGLAELKEGGYLLIVVTNQPDVARGTVTRESVEAIHERLNAMLPLDSIWLCPHDDIDRCECRKPAPGLILAASARHGVDPSRSWMIGDRWRDIEAGNAAGCRTILIDNPAYEEKRAEGADVTVRTFGEAVRTILGGDTDREGET